MRNKFVWPSFPLCAVIFGLPHEMVDGRSRNSIQLKLGSNIDGWKPAKNNSAFYHETSLSDPLKHGQCVISPFKTPVITQIFQWVTLTLYMAFLSIENDAAAVPLLHVHRSFGWPIVGPADPIKQ